MWAAIKNHFKDYPAQEKVARLLLSLGLSVRDKKIFCGDIVLPPLRVAKAAGVDRRAVTATIKTITEKKELNEVYKNLKTSAFFRDVAPAMKWSVIEIIPTNATETNIVAGVTKVIGNIGISVRQCISEDPEFSEDARLFIIAEKTIPPTAYPRLKRVKGVKSIVIH